MTVFESYFGESAGALFLVDEFAQARGTRGPMPAPIPPLRFQLTHREVANVMTELETPIDLKTLSGPSGAYVFVNEGREDKSPWQRLAEGRYRLRIESDYYQPFEIDLDWPLVTGAQGPQLLRPGYNYPFPDVSLPSERMTLLRGTVLSGVHGTPVENALVEITNPPALGAFVSARTDANGAWVLAFRHANLNPLVATVAITPPNAAQFNVPGVQIVPGADNSLAQTALRGLVLTTTGRPIRAAEVTVDVVPNQPVLSDRDGRWHFYFDLNQPAVPAAQVTATEPGGQNQVQNFPVISRATGVVPAFRIAI